MEKYSRVRQATDDVLWLMPFALWITKATNTNPEYVIRIAFFHDNSGYANAPKYGITHTLPIL